MFDRRKFYIRFEMEFSKDLKKSLEGFSAEEKIDIIDSILKIIQQYKKDPVDYDEMQLIHEYLLKKYRRRLLNFRNVSITDYFSDSPNTKHLLLQNELQVDHAGEDENFFTDEERARFLKNQERYLKMEKTFLYLQMEPVDKGEDLLKGIKVKKGGGKLRLNQPQTALLIYALRRTEIIYQGDYLNDTNTGKVFSILTGYSADNLRQTLNPKEIERVATNENIDTVLKALKDVVKYLEKERPE